MINRLKNKKGNISVYLMVTAIIVAAIITMGVAFSNSTKGAIAKDVAETNHGFQHYVDTTSKVKVNDAAE